MFFHLKLTQEVLYHCKDTFVMLKTLPQCVCMCVAQYLWRGVFRGPLTVCAGKIRISMNIVGCSSCVCVWVHADNSVDWTP